MMISIPDLRPRMVTVGKRTPLEEIVACVDELADPRQHTATSHIWVNRNKKLRRHITVQPGLMTQLYEAIMPGSGEAEGRTALSSRPPLALEAMSKHVEITAAVTWWCWELRVDLRDSVESNMRALIGAAATLDTERQKSLARDARRWRNWCAVLTGWEQVVAPRGVPCPVVECGKTGTLRINLTTKSAFCNNPDRDSDGNRICSAVWDEEDGSIAVLADYIASRAKDAA